MARNPFDEDVSGLVQGLQAAQVTHTVRTVTLQPGDLGLTFDCGSRAVVNVTVGSQCEKAGVMAGWRLHEINGLPFSRELLSKHLTGQQPYKVSFIPAALRSSELSLIGTAAGWEGDTEACGICKTYFTFSLRRHHCRLCGRCVCQDCSPSKLRLEGYGEELQRACTPCVEAAGRGATLAGMVSACAKRVAIMADPGAEARQAPADLSQAVDLLQDGVVALEDHHQTLKARLASSEGREAQKAAEAAALATQVEELKAQAAQSEEERRSITARLVALTGILGSAPSSSLPSSPFEEEVATAEESTAASGSFSAADTEVTLETAMGACEAAAPPLLESLQCLQQRLADKEREVLETPKAGAEVIDANLWEENTKECSVCEKPIGKRVLNRRHHCRLCGKCVCAGCSPSTLLLNEGQAPQRACTPCVLRAFKDCDTGGSETRSPVAARAL
mmetsp:Transcript_32872/g.83213  ORF Transcript_32872/g.83213 Transcript_32872/m.83213 type:complete len:448 (-) Transcript_32872:38-1381(-)